MFLLMYPESSDNRDLVLPHLCYYGEQQLLFLKQQKWQLVSEDDEAPLYRPSCSSQPENAGVRPKRKRRHSTTVVHSDAVRQSCCQRRMTQHSSLQKTKFFRQMREYEEMTLCPYGDTEMDESVREHCDYVAQRLLQIVDETNEQLFFASNNNDKYQRTKQQQRSRPIMQKNAEEQISSSFLTTMLRFDVVTYAALCRESFAHVMEQSLAVRMTVSLVANLILPIY